MVRGIRCSGLGTPTCLELVNLNKCAFTDHLKPMIIISLHTGMRRGEIFDLEWQNVDFSAESIAIVGETAKSGKTRYIGECLWLYVLRWDKRYMQPTPSELRQTYPALA